MAILMTEERTSNWKIILVIGMAILAVGGGVYLLFFTPTPGIEVLAPSSLRAASELSGIEFDPASVANDEIFRSLRSYVSQPTAGQTGRINPFISY